MIGLIGGRGERAAISDSVSAFGMAWPPAIFPKQKSVKRRATLLLHYRGEGGCFIREMVIIVMDRSVVSSVCNFAVLMVF